MSEIPKKYIKVNIPLTEMDYLAGNGEGVWVEVDEETRRAYDENVEGKGFRGILSNDSVYYPGLMCGQVIPFEMRGENRPVVDYYGFLEGRDRLTEEGKAAIVRKIAEAQMGGGANDGE
mgnify:CR=1 FL=1